MTEEVNVDSTNNANSSIEDRVVDFINNAMYVTKDNEKVEFLKKAQELVIHHDILDNFLDEILGFQSDKSIEVKKFVIGFIEAACKKDAEFFPKVIVNLKMLLAETNANIQKRAIQAATQLYRTFLKWISKNKITDIVESTWDVWVSIKQVIFSLLDQTDNDGVRTQCVKFMEMVVICQTKKDQWSSPEEFSIDSISNNKLVDVDVLEEEAKQIFEQLIIFHGTAHISSVNLMATMQTLVFIGRQRCHLFMSKVIATLEALHANLPPTLAKSQVSSVRKQLKMQLLILLKHPAATAASQFQSQITQLLNDLGAGQSEINKCLHEVKKRSLKSEGGSEVKRIKLEQEEDDDDNEFVIPPPKISRVEANTAIDITAEDIMPCLNIIENVSDLVLVSMLSLPDQMPAHFQASYTPVSAAGTSSQVKHLARLIASQLTAAGLGKGVREMVLKMTNKMTAEKKSKKNEQQVQEQQQKIAIVIGQTIAQELKRQEQLKIQQQQQQQQQQQKVRLTQSGKSLSGTLKARQLNLADITKELSDDVKQRMTIGAVNRILKEDKKMFFSSSQLETRVKILALFASQFCEQCPTIYALIQNYIFEDIRNRYEVAFNLIYNEYFIAKTSGGNFNKYSQFLSKTLQTLIEKTDIKDRDHFLMRFYVEVPYLTEESIALLRNFILSDNLYASSVTVGINILKAIIEKKKKQREHLLDLLLEMCVVYDKNEVRSFSIKTVNSLYDVCGDEIKKKIEDFATKTLQYLLESKPPTNISNGGDSWSDDTIKICLFLYLSLLPMNHKLIHGLAGVYVSTSADTKRIILRILESPVKGMGMNSSEILLLVEQCPKGAETLVTRIIHVLTDKQVPSAELVSRVRDLYHKRVADVRFLIPVLNGLSKKEVISALPKLIKLNPVVVKEVFNRLLGAHVESGTNFQSPLTPAELLIALHNIDTTKCDMKTIIKATGLCFAEKNIYTAEVLAVVMQLLMEQNPLPTLLMRTVIQSLSQYPRLIGFVMNILQRLILKQGWKQKKVWEGFIKCCQRTKPQSFQVLLQLPAPQLQTVFNSSPDLKPALQQHVQAFTDHQRSHIPQSLLDVIFASDDDNKSVKQVEDDESDDLNQDKEPPQTEPASSVSEN